MHCKDYGSKIIILNDGEMNHLFLLQAVAKNDGSHRICQVGRIRFTAFEATTYSQRRVTIVLHT
jgi:hypothetical protein